MRGERGFTLIEVLLAMAILALGTTLIVTISTRALSSVGTSRLSAEASELAQRKMGELVQAGVLQVAEETFWAPMDTSDLAFRPEWRKKVTLVPPLGFTEPAADPATFLRQLEVTVRLEEDEAAPAFRLSTPLPPAPPAAP